MPAPPALADEPPADQALILLAPDVDVQSVARAIQAGGGQVTHMFPPAALIGQVPAALFPFSEVLSIHRQPLDEASLAGLDGVARRAAQAWNALLAPALPAEAAHTLDSLAAELVGDALLPPPSSEVEALSEDDPSPGYQETSEYFIGRVAISIILPESDGSLDPSSEDWSEAERALVLSEITAALDWWAAREPRARLTFVYDDATLAPVATSYEPISRPYGDQSLWIPQVMAHMGYAGGAYFDQVRRHNNALRDTHDTDWAFTIFVVDSSNDADRCFADRYFAYAYLGGPFMVMTYGNDGYGPDNMDAVAAHEIGHIFLALDQYYSAYQPCTRQSGYLGIENQNSQYGSCASNLPSIMRGQVGPYQQAAVDPYARGQIGWRDADGDGILDPMDTTLSLVSADYVIDPEQPNVLTFTGRVEDAPYPSPLRRSTTINTIRQVHYRAAGGEWCAAQAGDGAFDTVAEAFTFTTPPLPSGDLAVELRVSDSAGNELIQTLANVSVVDPVDQILNTTLTRAGQESAEGRPTLLTYTGQGTSSTSFIQAIYYRIDQGAWLPVTPDDGVFDEPQESFSLSIDLTGLSPGVHQVQAHSVDGQGNIETSPASDALSIEAPTYYVFLPLLLAGH